MSHDNSSNHRHDAEEKLPADLAAVEQRLLHDGQDWRNHVSTTTNLEHYVRSRVSRMDARALNQYEGHTRMEMPPTSSPVARNAASYQRSLPIVSVALLLVLGVGFLVLRGFQPRSGTGVASGGPGTATTSTAIPTPIPERWFALTDSAYLQGQATPVQQFAVGTSLPSSSSLTLTAQFTADPQRVHSGDTIALVWQVNGTVLNGPNCCQFQPSPQNNASSLSVVTTATGKGSVKILYNSVLADTYTFTITDTPPSPAMTPTVLPSSPTPAPSSSGGTSSTTGCGYPPSSTPSPGTNVGTPTALPGTNVGTPTALPGTNVGTPTPTPHC